MMYSKKNQAVAHCRRGYPRPQHFRDEWQSLNGSWRFRFDSQKHFDVPSEISEWPLTIEVPFAPETEMSGVGDTGYHHHCWYQRDFKLSVTHRGRVILHFGAVDYKARVWLNNVFLGSHEGGHTPFSFDVTKAVDSSKDMQTVTVWVEDNPHDLAKPRGKQDWQLEPHSIWYPRTTGIWQSVWLESVSDTYVSRIRWTPLLERWEIGFEAFLGGEILADCEIRLTLSSGGRPLVKDTYQVVSGEVHRRIALSDPGIDDFRNELLWSPETPTLIHAEIELIHNGQVLDHVTSYTALRCVSVNHGDFMLNGRPYYLRLVLDQGYWPDSHLTAPSDEHLRRDVELVKQMGFNGVRKHQKIEDPRFLYWADVLGLLVWEEMPSAYRFTQEGVQRLMREWAEVIERDISHPSIVTWVPFNESWGVPDLAAKAVHRSCVQAFYHLTKTLDSTRPVVGNDGWESSATDIIGIHDYDNHPVRFRDRYAATTVEILSRRSPAGRLITIEGYANNNQPLMLTEFGGIAYTKPDESTTKRKAWGYSVSQDANQLQRAYTELLQVVHALKIFRGFCYTQLTDTFQEANGLLYADRTPKFPIAEIALATQSLTDHNAQQLAAPRSSDHPEVEDSRIRTLLGGIDMQGVVRDVNL